MDHILSALRAAGEPTRLRLLSLLARSELTVTELTQILGQSQPRVSRHLKLMAEAGLVNRYREGNWVFYRLADLGPTRVALGQLAADLVGYLPKDDPVLQTDMARLEAVRRDRAEAAAAYFRANADEWGRIQALHLPEEAIEDAIVRMIGPSEVDMLVDFGTGTGRILELLGNRVKRGIGIDYSHDMLALARTKLERAELRSCQVRHGDIFALNLGTGSADLVVIHQVLHFLADPSRAVGEAARVLREGGRLMIVDFDSHALEFLRDDHAHRRLGFSDREVQGWFDSSGLELVQVRKLPEPNLSPQHADKSREGEPYLTVCIWLAEKTGQPQSLEMDQPSEVEGELADDE